MNAVVRLLCEELLQNERRVVRFEAVTAATVKNVVLWDIKTPVRTSQETHYVFTTESSQLILGRI
jgi:hypothetical protein